MMQAIAWNRQTGQPLTDAYLQQKAEAVHLYGAHYRNAEAWSDRAAYLDAGQAPRADRTALVQALRLFNEQAGSGPAAMSNIERLADPSALVVIGGQQAGLWTGPLLVYYKALTIAKTASEASERLGRTVVPVFWIAGEDHDFEEVNHIYTLSSDMKLDKLKLQHPAGGVDSVSKLVIDPAVWEEQLQQLEASLMPTDFKPGLMDKLRTISTSSKTLTEAFARMAAWLFQSLGIVLMDAADPNIRRLESAMFQRLIEHNNALSEAVQRSKRAVEEAGFAPQAEASSQSAHLFTSRPGRRTLLYRDGQGGFVDRKNELRYSKQELLEWAAQSPELLSNNVMTRPLMQDYLFPVLAAVLGPSEIAYWAMTRDAFTVFGMQMPLLVPRIGFTLVEGTVSKNMTKYGLTMEDVFTRLEEFKQEWLRSQDTLKLDERFETVRAEFRRLYEPLLSDLSGLNPGLTKLGAANMDKIMEQLRYMEQKASDASESQFDAAIRQFGRIGMSLLPGGKPQERVYNITAYLNKYGEDWLSTLAEVPLDEDAVHYICYL